VLPVSSYFTAARLLQKRTAHYENEYIWKPPLYLSQAEDILNYESGTHGVAESKPWTTSFNKV
jgi:hypothetical protein